MSWLTKLGCWFYGHNTNYPPTCPHCGKMTMITIDLSSPDGNAFSLIKLADRWRTALMDPSIKLPTKAKLMDGGYTELLDQFDAAFKGRIEYRFINDPRHPAPDAI